MPRATGRAAAGRYQPSIMSSSRKTSLSVPIVYGSGAYGIGPFGFGFAAQTVGQMNWSLCAYGNLLLACPFGGTIYMYDPAQGGVAFPVLNAPIGVQAMLVTPERFMVALGQSGNLQTIAWAGSIGHHELDFDGGRTRRTAGARSRVALIWSAASRYRQG